MALYHFSVRHVSRGKGQMVVASAAYISGQRIFDSYYNKIHDYTSKSGVMNYQSIKGYGLMNW